MPIRKGKLHKPCKCCGEMYKPHTKTPGICSKCLRKYRPTESFIEKLAKERGREIKSNLT